MANVDGIGERIARRLARRSSRRSLLARLGAAVVAAPLFPLLPVARAAAPARPLTDFERNAQSRNSSSCDYWRHCALEGILCGCCGGGVHSCPPGSEPSPTAWVGTCLNPADGKHYVVSYNDCCGKAFCQRCFCNRNEGDRPVYYPSKSNDVNWCMGRAGIVYNSTVSIVIGVEPG